MYIFTLVIPSWLLYYLNICMKYSPLLYIYNNFQTDTYFISIPLYTPAKSSTTSDLTCSENVAYDTVWNIVKMSTPTNVPCCENVAYATVINKEDKIQITCTSHAAVYEEVQV